MSDNQNESSYPISPVGLEAVQRYEAELHAVQSAIKYLLDVFPDEAGATPKHLRVGINSSMVQNGALVKVLIDKGILTLDEWYVALADAMAQEHASLEQRVHQLAGVHINFG